MKWMVAIAALALAGCEAHRAEASPIPVALLSARAKLRWDVSVDDRKICTTPCKRSLDPTRPIKLHARGDTLPADFEVPDLFPAASQGPVQLRIIPGNPGIAWPGGIALTLGLLGDLVGIAVTVVGCTGNLNDSHGCQTGLIMTGVGALLTAAGAGLIWLGYPKAEVMPLQESLANGGPPAPDY